MINNKINKIALILIAIFVVVIFYKMFMGIESIDVVFLPIK